MGTKQNKQVTDEDIRLLTPDRVAELLGVTTAALRKWRLKNEGPAYQYMNKIGKGGDIRYRPAAVLAWQKRALRNGKPSPR
jgi:hypothetical protein